MDHNQLVARLGKEITSARAAIITSYQRLWRPAHACLPDPADTEPGGETQSAPAAAAERPLRQDESG